MFSSQKLPSLRTNLFGSNDKVVSEVEIRIITPFQLRGLRSRKLQVQGR